MGEILIIAVIGLLVFGPRKLPEIARNAGRALHEFKRVTGELTEELKAGLDEPPASPRSAASTPAAPVLTGTEMLPVPAVLDSHGGTQSDDSPVDGPTREPPPGKDV